MNKLSIKLKKIEGPTKSFLISNRQGEITTPAMMSKKGKKLYLFEKFNIQEGKKEKVPIVEEKIYNLPHILPEFRKNTVQEKINSLTVNLDKEIISLSYYPHASVYQPLARKDIKLLLIKDLQKKIGARKIFNFITQLREIFPSDTVFTLLSPIYPEYIPFLVYLGVDIVNIDPYLIQVWRNKEKLLQALHFGWNINLTQKNVKRSEDIERYKRYNKNYLNYQFETLRYFIEKENFRNLIETWIHTSHKADSFLTIIDNEKKEFLSRYVSFQRSFTHDFIGEESFHRPIVSIYSRKIKEQYLPPKVKVILFLPCAAKKPYSTSPSHKEFLKTIRSAVSYGRYKLHEVMVTSPFGLVPRELETTPPTVNYDITVTGHWSERELAHTADTIKSYLKKQRRRKEPKVLLHLEGGYLKATKRALEEVKLPYEVTAEKHPRSRKSLNSLKKALKNKVDKNVQRKDWLQRSLEGVKGVLSYQFNSKIAKKIVRNQKVVGKPHTKRWRIKDTVRFLPSLGFFLPLRESARILADEKKWAVLLKNEVHGKFLTSEEVYKVMGKIHIGELFVGIKDGKHRLVGQALLPSRKMNIGRNLKVARILEEF